MAYTVVFKRDNDPRWKWYVAWQDGHRVHRLEEGAEADPDSAGEEAAKAFARITKETKNRRMVRS